MTNEEKINLIGQKILLLSNNLNKYDAELKALKQQLDSLQSQSQLKAQPIIVNTPFNIVAPKEIKIEEKMEENSEVKTEEIPFINIPEIPVTVEPQTPLNTFKAKQKPTPEFNFEQFVGGKLITIIGIIILVIGLGIGVKYAIDNDMLGPLGRIVLAYSAGSLLLFLAFRLKLKYKSFSAVLLSGAMASLYFTTFAAYSLYNLFPQTAAFAIMVLFTTFTVFAATVYNLEIIGVIGLVGGYAVPLLLSDGSGKIEIMFSYMVIINSGILILSFKKYWQILQHTSYGLTWLIVAAWFADKYDYQVHSSMAIAFTFLFFIIFYISNVAYKMKKLEKFGLIDIIRIVSNSFLFFGLGYFALNNENNKEFLGMFTVANALIHLVFAYFVFRNKLMERNLFYLLIAMVLGFVTIAVPVQLEGSWVTLFWIVEAFILFYIGRTKSIRFYEWLGFIMVGLGLFSLLNDWGKTYMHSAYSNYLFKFWIPFFNIYFFTSILFILSLIGILFFHHKKTIADEIRKRYIAYGLVEISLPVLLFMVIYFTFSNELTALFRTLYQQSEIKIPSKELWAEAGAVNIIYDQSYLAIQKVVLAMYNLAFFIIVGVLAITKFKATSIRWIAFSLMLFVALTYLLGGLQGLSSLRNNFLLSEQSEYYSSSSIHLYIRYFSFVLFALLLYCIHKLLKTETFKNYSISRIYSGCIIHFFVLLLLCNELMNINKINNFGTDTSFYLENNVYKLGFTIIWGVYSFLMIAVGIAKKNKILRISAISLMGISILKLLLVDTWNLTTGYKIICYLLLGVILLIVAFLYQKFKKIILGEE